MGKLTIWHNPRCRKSREALQLLKDKATEIEIVRYLEKPPTLEELDRVLNLLDLKPRELIRKKEAPYKDLDLADASHTRNALIAAMVANPILIERPVVIHGDRAVLGRPPENVLALFD